MDKRLVRFVSVLLAVALLTVFALSAMSDSRATGLLANPPVGGGSSATGVGDLGLQAGPPVGGGSSATGVGGLGLLANPPVGGGSSAT